MSPTGITCTVYADGWRVADGSPGDDPLAPNALSGLQVTWGRDTPVDQCQVPTCSLDLVDAPGGPAFRDTFLVGTEVVVLASVPGRDSTVFQGRVTECTTAWDDTLDAPRVRVLCDGLEADLENNDVGDTPWPLETWAARLARISNLVWLGQDMDVRYDTSLIPTPVQWRDVDRQPVTGLFAELATTGDAVLWPGATYPLDGWDIPSYLFEDPTLRPTGVQLVKPGAKVIIQVTGVGTWPVDACEIEQSAPTWTQDVHSVASQIDVGWLSDATPAGPLHDLTDQTYSLTDPDLYAAVGIRVYSVTTARTNATDAAAMAQRVSLRTKGGWHADGITLDDLDVAHSAATIDRGMSLLDCYYRAGTGLTVSNLPAWVPVAPTVPLGVEGGTATYAEGRWVLDLNVSDLAAIGHSVTWDEVNTAWAWDDFDNTITWDSLQGVGA